MPSRRSGVDTTDDDKMFTRKVDLLYETKKTTWEVKNKRKISSSESWKLHEEAVGEIKSRMSTSRKRNSSTSDARASKRGRYTEPQSYKGTRGEHDKFSFGVYGNGVDIRVTTIMGATSKNKGLFTERAFKENELITEYTGPRITKKEALRLKKEGKASHIRGLNYDFCIDGDKHPIKGQGIAQFANDATREGKNNAKFELKYDHGLGEMRCFIKAVRILQADEEIYVGYGNGYWLTDRTTGEKIYDEDAHEKHLQRIEDLEREEQAYEQERQLRKVQKRAEAKLAREKKLEADRREEQQRAAKRQKEQEVKLKEKAKLKEKMKLQRDKAKLVKERKKEKEREKKEKKQKEVQLAEAKKLDEARARESEAARARAEKAAATRLDKKRREEEVRRRAEAIRQAAEDKKHAHREREEQIYEELRDVWEEKHGKSISSEAAWSLWEIARVRA